MRETISRIRTVADVSKSVEGKKSFCIKVGLFGAVYDDYTSRFFFTGFFFFITTLHDVHTWRVLTSFVGKKNIAVENRTSWQGLRSF